MANLQKINAAGGPDEDPIFERDPTGAVDALMNG